MRRFLIITITIMSVTLTGCYSPSGDIPEDKHSPATRAFTQKQVADAVVQDFVRLHAPVDLEMPEECQFLRYNHFYPQSDNAPKSFANSDAVIMLMPGMQAGASVFTYYAEQLVFAAQKERNANVHVLTLERRNQCLVDNTGLEAAAVQGNIDVAAQYYYHNASINEAQFKGFYKDRDLPFLSQFSLERILTDIKTVAEHVFPNQEERLNKLYIGGHSLGGNITSAFMGWDFDGNPDTLDDAGMNQAAGFIRLDISITPKDESLDPFLNYGSKGFEVDPNNETNRNYRFAAHQIDIGTTPRIQRLPGASPETFMLLELLAMKAHWAPEEEALEIQQLPLGSDPKLLLRILHSRDTFNFINHSPSIFDYRFTNEALLGVILDDDFMPITILQGSFGFLSNAPIKEKSFPSNEAIRSLASSFDDFLGFLITDVQQFIATDAGETKDNLGTGPIYGWANYDEVGSAQDPSYKDKSQNKELTNYIDEMTDIEHLARIIYQGQTSFTEWYMPQKMSLDLQQLRETDVVEGLNFFHYRQARNARLLEIAGTESIVRLGIEPLGELIIAEGYNHIDVLTAANDTPHHRENVVLNPTLDFVLQ